MLSCRCPTCTQLIQQRGLVQAMGKNHPKDQYRPSQPKAPHDLSVLTSHMLNEGVMVISHAQFVF